MKSLYDDARELPFSLIESKHTTAAYASLLPEDCSSNRPRSIRLYLCCPLSKEVEMAARASLPLGNFDQNFPGLFGHVGFHGNLTNGIAAA